MSLGPIEVAAAYATQDTPSVPVEVGSKLAQYKGPLNVEALRAGSTGAGSVRGKYLPGLYGIPSDHSERTDEGRRLLGSDDGIAAATGRSYFDTDIDYVAASKTDWNWIVIVENANGTRTVQDLAGSISTSAGQFFISDNSGKARITIGASVAGGEIVDSDIVEAYYLPTASVELLAVPAAQFKKGKASYGADVAWYDPDNTATPSATSIYVEPQA